MEEVTCITIDDKDYIILDEIEDKNTTYVYLSNKDDDEDFFIRIKENEELLPLNSNEEFDKALKLFKDKHINEFI